MTGKRFGIRAKVFLLIALTLGAGSVLLALTLRGFLLDGFLRSETEQMHDELDHVETNLATALDDLSEYATEYSAWDDTWEYLGGEHPEYFSENFTFSSSAYRKLSLAVILDTEGRLVAGTTYDAASQAYGPVPAEFLEILRRHPELRRHAEPESAVKGLLALGGWPVLLASRPIVRNDLKGPIRGTLLIGELLDDRMRRRLGSAIQKPIHVYRVGAPDLPAEVGTALAAIRAGRPFHIERPDSRRMVGYSLLPDVTGAPAFLLRLDLDRSLYRNGLRTLRILLVAFGVATLLAAGGHILLAEHSVLRRIIRLGQSVAEVGAGAAPTTIASGSPDEIGVLAAQIRDTFVSRQHLMTALEEAAVALERRVVERTQTLQETIEALNHEVAVRREAEEQVRDLERRQRAVFENMVSSLLTFDDDLRVTEVNPAALRLLRLTASCVGHPLTRALPPPLAAAVEAAYRTGEATVSRQGIRVDLAEGRELILDTVLSSIPPEGDRRRSGILLLLDRTDERRLAAEQGRLNRLALLGKFSAQVAHELRNPLTAMRSTAQYLEASSEGRERELFRVLMESVERMDTIIRRMRLLTREMPLERTAVDLTDLLANLLRFVDASLRAQGIEARFRPPARPVQVLGDPAQLHQALLNLIMNAMQAMPGGGRLRLRLGRGRPQAGEAPPVIVLVADSGSGIAPEVAGRIFDPFFTTREAGSGLGLPIADRIVRDHGGSIRFTSRPGRGTRFAVILPGGTGGEPCRAS